MRGCPLALRYYSGGSIRNNGEVFVALDKEEPHHPVPGARYDPGQIAGEF